MGKSSGVRKSLANYSAINGRLSGMIFLSNLQKGKSACLFSNNTIYWKIIIKLKTGKKGKIGRKERSIFKLFFNKINNRY